MVAAAACRRRPSPCLRPFRPPVTTTLHSSSPYLSSFICSMTFSRYQFSDKILEISLVFTHGITPAWVNHNRCSVKSCILMFHAMHENLACNYITQITSRKWHFFDTTTLTWPCKSLAKVIPLYLYPDAKGWVHVRRVESHTRTLSLRISHTHTPVTWHPLKQTHMLQFVHPRVHVMLRIYLSRKANPNSSCIHSPPAASSLVAVAR